MKCYWRGGDHKTHTCKYTNVKCRYCGKVGHFEKVCMKKKRENSGKVHYVEEDEDVKDCENSGSYLFHFSSYCRDVNKISKDQIVVTPRISETDIPMEVVLTRGQLSQLFRRLRWTNT